MLRTRERTLLLASLRPPAGYRLGRAVGTSYTLDPIALLTAPLAFTFFDVHDEDGAPMADPVALLEALRRHAEKVTLFCQAGAIAVPKPEQALLAYLEGSIVTVRPAREEGIFHPKAWVLEFTADDALEVPVDHPRTVYRFLCLSRNLTFDRAWDTCLCLEGPLSERQRGYTRNAPLAEFLEALPGLATRRPLPRALRDDLRRIAGEVRRVDFRPPGPFEDFRIHPLGLGRGRAWPFPEARRSLAISPYLVGSVVERLAREHGLEILISRPEAFEEIVRERSAAALPGRCYVLAPAASLDAREIDEDEEAGQALDEGGERASEGRTGRAREGGVERAPEGGMPGAPDGDRPELAGLHAKLFLFEEGRTTRVFTGSANATAAALRLNVELLVELVGRTKDCGIAALLGPEGDAEDEGNATNGGGPGQEDTLRSLLQEYASPEIPEEVDSEQRVLDREVDRVSRALASARLTAMAREVDAGRRWDLALSGEIPDSGGGAEVKVWPVTLPATAARLLAVGDAHDRAPRGGPDEIATFEGLSFEALTGFFAFDVSMTEGPRSAHRRFTVPVELLGAPEDRKERLLRSFLKDSRQVLRLLLLLLMDEGADVSVFVEFARDGRGGSTGPFGGWDEPTLLEALLHSLSRDPGQVEQASRLIADLRKTPEGRELLPEGLEEIWEPVWAVRETLEP